MWYAQRNSVCVRSDEDRAMAHKREGGFYERNDAHQALISMVEKEIAAWRSMSMLNAETLDRLETIRERLIEGETDVTWDGLRFNIYNV